MPSWHLSAAPSGGQSLDLHRRILSLKWLGSFEQVATSLYLLVMDLLGGLMRQKLDVGCEAVRGWRLQERGPLTQAVQSGKVRELGL